MIELIDIHKTYRNGAQPVHALRGISLQIAPGEFIALTGPSGSGKSTLMHILGLLDTPTHGIYRLNGREVSALTEDESAGWRNRSIGFIFQTFNLLPRTSALENVALPLIYSNQPAPTSPAELLKMVGLGNREKHTPNELSGGQQQRVAIARALVNRPPILLADEPTGNLDSASSAEILAILRNLHQSGLTVILVTHDPEIARRADRLIVLRDGKITDDSGRKPLSAAAPPPAAAAADAPAGRIRRKVLEGRALLKQAARALGANKTRTLLSMLGVLIGVAAVIGVLALGAGAQQTIEEHVRAMGANLLVLRTAGGHSGGVALGTDSAARLTPADAEYLKTAISTLSDAAPSVNGNVQATYESNNWRTRVLGVTPNYFAMHAVTPAFGRIFTAAELQQRARVAVVGITVSEKLFGAASPLGQTIRLNKVAFEIVGVLPTMGSTPMQDANDQVIIPITTAMHRLLGKTYADSIEMQVDDAAHLEYTEAAAVVQMYKRHRIPAERTGVFSVFNMADIQKMLTSTSQTMSWLLAGIGAISLLVGGIGIMNIMLVSVTERTREIGLRKALGARRADILTQFLLESAAVGVCGGIIGIALGCGAALAMSRLAGWTTAITGASILSAFGFSVVIGMVFGLWPAQKAARLAPIEALRHE